MQTENLQNRTCLLTPELCNDTSRHTRYHRAAPNEESTTYSSNPGTNLVGEIFADGEPSVSLPANFLLHPNPTLTSRHGGFETQQRTEVAIENRARISSLIPLLPTISRTLSLSFQSSFHLSLMVLVHYRSLANI